MNASDYLDGLAPLGRIGDGPAAAHRQAIELSFDEARASAFAKGVAGDFNPLHDVGSKRFCVPGDLLFSALLQRYGLWSETSVGFAGMLGATSRLTLPAGEAAPGTRVHLLDERAREVMSLYVQGTRLDDTAFVARLTEEYVRFSGRTFPGILVPLMRAADVMINPDRPLIIYKDMAIRLDADAVAASLAAAPAGSIDAAGDVTSSLTLVPGQHAFSVSGKKGAASIRFTIERGGRTLGDGEKNFVLTGLREHVEEDVQRLLEDHARRVAAQVATQAAEADAAARPAAHPAAHPASLADP